MKLSVILALIFLITITCTGVLFCLMQLFMVDGIVNFEAQNVHNDMSNLNATISAELTQLRQNTEDYAFWNDTYNFVQSPNQGYIETNLASSSYQVQDINLILFVNSSGLPVYAQAYNLQTQQFIPVPADLTTKLNDESLLVQPSGANANSTTTGIMTLDGVPYLISSEPILTSNEGGPSDGTLIFGQILDLKMFSEFGQDLGLNLSLLPATAAQVSTRLGGANGSSGAIQVSRTASDVMTGYLALNDIYGEPACVIVATAPMSVYTSTQSMTEQLFIAFVAVGFLTGAGDMFLLRRELVSKINALGEKVRSINPDPGNAPKLLETRIDDEVQVLTDSINDIISKFSSSQEQIRRSEESLKKYSEHLEELVERKTKEREMLLSKIAHELRTPLASMMGYLNYIMSDSPELSNETREKLEVVQKNVRRLVSLTSDILDYKKIESGNLSLDPKPVNFKEILDECTKEMAPFLDEKRQTLAVKVSEAPLVVQGDPLRLVQIMMNLLNNASKFTPDNGSISVQVEEDGGGLRVLVSDSGTGIRQEDLERVFIPFAKIEKSISAKGTSLGLSITKGLVEAHGGKIWAESQGLGKGATFIFTIPKLGGNHV